MSTEYRSAVIINAQTKTERAAKVLQRRRAFDMKQQSIAGEAKDEYAERHLYRDYNHGHQTRRR